jgi:predicted deacylase
MQTVRHDLPSPSVGTQRHLISLHYGPADSGRKAYLQASLHADELPGMLVAHHLRGLLEQAEAAGQMQAQVVLVPVANPIGLSNALLRTPLGRFEPGSGENFNRHYPMLTEAVAQRINGQLTQDAAHNRSVVRAAIGAELRKQTPTTEIEGLRQTLMLLAHDADVVLDLHCDFQAVMHLYTEAPYWPVVEPLARCLGAHAALLNQQPGGHSFDEALGGPWWQLAERFPEHPIPLACADVTVELRGQADVDHGMAQADARALMQYLQHQGFVSGPAPELPPLLNPATPLAGSEPLKAPHAGVLAFHKQPGDHVTAGDVVCDVIDPLSNTLTPVRASVSGVLYARTLHRYARAGMDLADIAGSQPMRTGWLLSD